MKVVKQDYANHRYERAEKIARMAVDEARACPKEKILLARNLNWLSHILACQSRWYEAIPVAEEALSLAKSDEQKDKTLLPSIYSGMACCYEGEGALEKAAQALLHAISSQDSLHKADDQEILRYRRRLADIRYEEGKYKECLVACESLLSAAKAKTDSATLAKSFSLMGKASEKLGKTDKAEDYYQQAADLTRGSGNVVSARYLAQLGMFYERTGSAARAADACRRSLESREEALIDDAQKMNNGQKLALLAQTGPGDRKDFILSLQSDQPDRSENRETKRILAFVNRSVSAMSPKVIEALARTGCRVVIVSTLGGVSQRLQNWQPMGYSDGASWDLAGGIYEDRYNLVLIPREVSVYKMMPMIGNYRVAAVVRHELGHALDEYLGSYSKTDSYSRRYLEDKSKLSEEQKKHYAYYLQAGTEGQGEAFAELFNNLCGGDSGGKQKKELFRYFPKTYALMKEELVRRGLLDSENAIAQQ
jgi:tetratricopeptide (TPR) repeat protein